MGSQRVEHDWVTEQKQNTFKHGMAFKKFVYFLHYVESPVLLGLLSSFGVGGYSLVAVLGLLLWRTGSKALQLQLLQHTGSVVVAPGLWCTGSVFVVLALSCSVACGIFPDHRSNAYLLNWQAVLYHWATRESPSDCFLWLLLVPKLLYSMGIYI